MADDHFDLGRFGLDVDWKEQIMPAVVEQMGDLAEHIAARMYQHCPVSATGSNGRPPGYLRSSIYWHVNPETGEITAGAHADYAYPVEVGHWTRNHKSFVPAQSFIRRAVREVLDSRGAGYAYARPRPAGRGRVYTSAAHRRRAPSTPASARLHRDYRSRRRGRRYRR